MGDYADDFGEPPEPRGKKKGGGGFLKFCLICGCIVILLGGLAAGFLAYQASQLISIDPATIATRTQDTILPCTFPPGYEGAMYMKMPMVTAFVMAGPPGMLQNQNRGQPPALMIWLMTVPPGQSPQQLQTQMQMQMQQQNRGNGPNMQMQADTTQKRMLKVRGQDVEFTEELGSQGTTPMRRMSAVIPRAAGGTEQVLILFMGPEPGFDQAAFEAFLASIR